MELFRRETISVGKAAPLLGKSRPDFIPHAADLGIPYFKLEPDDWETERAFVDSLRMARRSTRIRAL